MELTNENYHSTEARKEYCGASQYKDFKRCEAEALAKVNGEIEEKKSDALLFGSYVDAWFSEELPIFTKAHPELFNKQGVLLAKYAHADKVIDSIKNDELFYKMLNGEHQVIMTGEISGVKYKIKIDSYHKNKYIVDGKCMKDMKPIWVEDPITGRNKRVNFIENYGYVYQAAIYQEIVRQNNGGIRLPFILAVVTKESEPEKALLEIDQEDIDRALEEVKAYSPRIKDIKEGKVEPRSCGVCDYCRSKKKVSGIFSWHTKDPKEYKEDDVEF